MLTASLAPSSRNTKTELLKAYEDLHKQYEVIQQNQVPVSVQATQKKEELAVLEKTAQVNAQTVEHDVSNLRQRVNVTLDDMLNQLRDATIRLTELRKDFATEKNY